MSRLKKTGTRRKLIMKILIPTTILGISSFFIPWIIIKAWILPLPDTVEEQLEQSLNYELDGLIVYIDQGAGYPTESYAAGWHNRDQKIPAHKDALFKIASIGKLYDAAAITRLVSAGRLDLDQSLAHYFPEIADRVEFSDKISLRLMLQHRSGIPNFTDSPNFWNIEHESAQACLELILDQEADFEPDEDYAYSNTNYLLIGMLIEKTVGYSKFQFIKESILDSLMLKNTFGSLKDIDSNRLMSGYYVGIEKDLKMVDYGSMIASAEDVGIFLRALNDGSLFSKAEQEIYGSIYVYDHTGLIPGYQSFAEYYEELDLVIVLFSNTADFSGYNWNLAWITKNRIKKIVKRRN